MNQRMANCRSDAAVPRCKLVECRHGCRIAQHHGNLTPFATQCRLALSAGLGSGDHLLARHDEAAERLCGDHRAPQLGVPRPESVRRVAVLAQDFACRAERHGLALAEVFQRVVFPVHEHFCCLRSGPIPPMDESYTVTSDNATTILQVPA